MTNLAAYAVRAVDLSTRERGIGATAAWLVIYLPSGTTSRVFGKRPVIDEGDDRVLLICGPCGSYDQCAHAKAVREWMAAPPTTPSLTSEPDHAA